MQHAARNNPFDRLLAAGRPAGMAASATVTTASRGMRALAVLGRCVRAPFRVLVRARDLYVSRMAACAGGGGGGGRGGGPVGLVAMPRCQSHGFYRSAAMANDDVRELIRAASRAGPARALAGVGPRSQSVAIGRIDEDRACEFGMEDGERAQAMMWPRSKSGAVGPSARTTARRVGVAV